MLTYRQYGLLLFIGSHFFRIYVQVTFYPSPAWWFLHGCNWLMRLFQSWYVSKVFADYEIVSLKVYYENSIISAFYTLTVSHLHRTILKSFKWQETHLQQTNIPIDGLLRPCLRSSTCDFVPSPMAEWLGFCSARQPCWVLCPHGSGFVYFFVKRNHDLTWEWLPTNQWY